jgi:hypothetical protein
MILSYYSCVNTKSGSSVRDIKHATFSGLLILLLLSLSSPLAFAQNITVNNDLTFGSIFPGVPKTVSKYVSGEAAEFNITGTPNAEVSIDFTLPSYMHTTGDNMQLIFSTTDCAIDSSAVPDQANPLEDNINPRHTILSRLGSNGLTIWLGGGVVPALNQRPGDYSAVIVLTVGYTGN